MISTQEEKRLQYLRDRRVITGKPWQPKELTDEQKKEQEKYVKENNLPF